MRISIWSLLMIVAMPALAADDNPWLRCRSIADPPARLACYDGMPLPAATPPTASTPTLPATAAAPRVATTTAADDTQQFGFEGRVGANVTDIRSVLPGPFEGWGPRARFKLANGQVWQSTESTSASYNLRDPKVQIRRAAFGSYLMDIDGVAQLLRVRRVE